MQQKKPPIPAQAAMTGKPAGERIPSASMAVPAQTKPVSEGKALQTFIAPRISQDGYSASVTILRNDPSVLFGSETIRRYLENNNITYGVREDRLKELIQAIQEGPARRTIVIAEGAALEEGKDGVADFKFHIKLLAGKVDEQKINFRERGLINNVREGQLLAEIIPEVPGKPGMKVDGNVVSPQPIRSVKIPSAGLNVVMKQQNGIVRYYSEIDGHARLVFDEIQVNASFVIIGDLDFTKGNIDCIGSVEIKGTVKSGFSVVAGGDVIINGDVESDARIQSKNDIVVKGSINCGQGTGAIIAGKNITAMRIINSKVDAGGDVFVKEQILDSAIYCSGTFATSSAKIVGCRIVGISGVQVNTIGRNDGNSNNYIDVGKDVDVASRLEKIDEELKQNKNEQLLLLKATDSELTFHDKDFDNLEINEQDKIKKVGAARTKHAKALKERQQELEKERNDLLPRTQENLNARLVVKGCIYPSCFIRIGKKDIKVLDGKKAACIIDGTVDDSQLDSNV